MTKNKDIDEIVKWMENLKGAQQYIKDFASPLNWGIYRNFYRGEFQHGTVNQRKYSVALIFAILRSMLPRIYFTNPQVVVTNEVPGYYLQSKIVQKIDNKMIRKTKLKQTLKELILDAGLCGTVPLLTGFDTAYGYDPRFKETVTDDEGRDIEIGGTLLQFDEKTGDRLEYDQHIIPGKPWADKIRPEFFMVPYGYDRLHKVPWEMRMYVRHLDDVKKDPRLINKKDIKANAITTFDWMKEKKLHQMMPKQNFGDFVFLWEIRDLKTGRLMIMQEGHKKFLYNEKDELQKFGNPYMELTFNYDPLTYWGIPDAKYLEDQQLAINEVRTLQMEHRRISKLRFIYDENIITDDNEITKVQTEDTGVGIKANGDVDKAIKIFQPYVPPDFDMNVDAIRKDARESVGLGRNQAGEFEGGRRTATESQIVQMASQIRISERKDMVADLLVDIVEKYNQYMFSEYNVQQVEDIIGPDGVRYWVNFTYEQIKSKYSFRVDPESGMPVSSETRKQEAIMVAQYIHGSPLVAMAMQPPAPGQKAPPMPYNLEALDRFVLSQFEGVPLDEIMPLRAGAGGSPETPISIEGLQEKLAAGGEAGATV